MQTVSDRLLASMGRELAAVQLGVTDRRRLIVRDLDKRSGDAWLADSAGQMAEATRSDFKAFRGPLR
jgi:hypothetical protein